jgi:hypothetical protein
MTTGAPINVLDFGADNTGTIDSTTAINNALSTASNIAKAVYLPAGTYLYSGNGTLGTGVVVFGDGRNASVIQSSVSSPTNGFLFNAAGYGSGLKQLKFMAGVPQTGGTYVALSGVESFIEDFEMQGDINGINMTGSVARIRHGRFENGATNAIRIYANGGDTSQLIDDVLMGAQLPQVCQAGIQVQNSAALIISNTSVIQQGIGLYVTSNTSLDVFSMYVNNCFFDNNSGNALRFLANGSGNICRCRFSNCWFGSSTNDGIFIANPGTGLVQGLYFDSCHSVLNGASGLTTSDTVSDIVVTGGLFADNVNGMYFNAGATNCRVDNCTIGVGGGLNANSNAAIVMVTGASDIVVTSSTIRGNASGITAQANVSNFVISDNDLSGATSPITVVAGTSNYYIINNNILGGGTVSDGGTGSSKNVANNF